ncbi:MAG: hypothetical protein VB071_00625, partial [Lawsonibacter sp.]|nr:hypothetical protein [Lawsonibacter sp.]
KLLCFRITSAYAPVNFHLKLATNTRQFHQYKTQVLYSQGLQVLGRHSYIPMKATYGRTKKFSGTGSFEIL